jgi:chemotaxis protein CheX
LDPRHVECFITGAKYVFKTMLDVELIHEKPYQKETNRSTADVTGVLGFTGDMRGTMAISMSALSAIAIYERLMHEHFDKVSSEIMDAMGELTNIISGQARKELEAVGLHLTGHVPLVFVGNGVEVTLATRGVIMVIPFTFIIDGVTESMNLACVFE